MHEFGMAARMLSDALERANGGKLKRITLSIGPLSGVSRESLRFCMDMVLEERNMKGVEVETLLSPLIFSCKCGRDYSPAEPWDPCPFCGKLEREAKGAKECAVTGFEVET